MNPWISPYLNVRDQLNYGLMPLMNELQAIKPIMGGPSRGRENKTTNTAANLAKAEVDQASSSKARNKRKGGQKKTPQACKSCKDECTTKCTDV